MGKSKKYRGWAQAPQFTLPVRVADNHTHLPLGEWEIPNPEGERVSLLTQLQRAWTAGVGALISSGCELVDWAGTLALAQQNAQVFAALAVHPNEAPLHFGVVEAAPDGHTPEPQPQHLQYDFEAAMSLLASHLDDPNVLAVGETGLDYYRTGPAGVAAQKKSFRAHIELAKQTGLPLQIHDREAHADTIEILLADGAPERTVFHCYSGDAEMAQILADNGWYASFAGPVSYRANEYLREAARALPRELLLVETDAPYLTPMPHRGQPNASYLLGHTIFSLSETLECDFNELCEQLYNNTVSVYGEQVAL